MIKKKVYKKVGRIRFWTKSAYDSYIKNKKLSQKIDNSEETKRYKKRRGY